MSLFSIERHRIIVERAREYGRADVLELSELLEVSPETVRRDLAALQKSGLLRRVHGGAVPIDRSSFESDLSTRSTRMHEEKARIAEAAVEEIGNAEAVYLDEGAVLHLVADRLRPERALTVVTNSLTVASTLAGKPNITVITLGGRVRPKTLGTVDFWAVNMLSTLVLDLAILGANGISVERGLTVPEASIAEVKATATKQARRRVLIGDHTKVGNDSFVRFAGLTDMDKFITDAGLGLSHVDHLRSSGISLKLV